MVRPKQGENMASMEYVARRLVWHIGGLTRIEQMSEKEIYAHINETRLLLKELSDLNALPIKDDNLFAGKSKEEIKDLLSLDVDALGLSARASMCLAQSSIRTVGELVLKSEADLLRTRNFGRVSMKNIKEALAKMSLSLNLTPEQLERASN